MKRFQHFLLQFVAPRSPAEDTRRREFILNILLVSCIALLAIASLADIVNFFSVDVRTYSNDSLGTFVMLAILGYFLVLYRLSRNGHIAFASYLLTWSIFFLPAYMDYRWGIDVPIALVFYPLVIIIGGVLISTRFALIVTLTTAITMCLTGYLESVGAITVNTYWRHEAWSASDVVVILLAYGITATVAWLSNRETERSLVRARASEAALKDERDTLEVRVQERTQELRKSEMEKMSQAYRFVEFGRLASGLFHDLMNPLTALSLNIESIAHSQSKEDPHKLEQMTQDVSHARSATTHIQRLVDSLRRHISREERDELFSVQRTLEEVITILNSYARQKEVDLTLVVSSDIEIFGDPVAFSQVITNILSNAIESGADSIHVTLADGQAKGIVRGCITIRDTGPGMSEDVRQRIFEPFFTTKGANGGLGIGLASAKRIIEKDFGGEIEVQSSIGNGTTFTIYFSIREP